MPSLYAPMSGVNTKQKTVYGLMSGVNTKQKNGYGLIAGVNSKIFNSEITWSTTYEIGSERAFSVHPSSTYFSIQFDAITQTIDNARGATFYLTFSEPINFSAGTIGSYTFTVSSGNSTLVIYFRDETDTTVASSSHGNTASLSDSITVANTIKVKSMRIYISTGVKSYLTSELKLNLFPSMYPTITRLSQMGSVS